LIQNGLNDLRSSTQIQNLHLPSVEEVMIYCGIQAIKMGYFLEPKLIAQVINDSQYLGPSLHRLQYYCNTLSRKRDKNVGEWCWPICSVTSSVPSDTTDGSLTITDMLLLDSDLDTFTNPLDTDDDENPFQSRLLNYFGPYMAKLDRLGCDYSQFETRLDIYRAQDPIQLVTNPLKMKMEVFPFVSMMCKTDVGNDSGIISAGTRRTRKNFVKRHLDFMTHEEEVLFADLDD
jgi:hypothetical protein